MKILLEMRPALDGHAGIPQETRLLFRALQQLPGVTVEGLIQSSNRLIAPGIDERKRLSNDRRMNRLSRVVVSLQAGGGGSRWGDRLRSVRAVGICAGELLAAPFRHGTRLGSFDPSHFKDFVWRSMFAKTLSHEDFARSTSAGFRVARMPWTAAHLGGLLTRRFGAAWYPRLDTRDFDVMVAETPYPGRVSPGTSMVVRYHDAIPLLMPHTISDRSFHQASHYHALRRNVADGGWFACVSDATRSDLLAVFPAAEKRSLTIPNMVSHHYFPEESDWRHVPEVLRIRRNISLAKESARDAERAVAGIAPVRYLLMVSTIEPRKNHMALLAAWERLRASAFPDLQLVLVGALGWHHEDILQRLTPWLSRGGLHILSDVPADELRLLYRHAGVVVCPSFGEGFDYSGVEAMRCGSAVAASDIPVHRDVFGDAAQYFSPYAPGQLADALMSLLSPSGAVRRGELARLGAQVSNRYLPENVLPQWQRFLDSLPKRQLK